MAICIQIAVHNAVNFAAKFGCQARAVLGALLCKPRSMLAVRLRILIRQYVAFGKLWPRRGRRPSIPTSTRIMRGRWRLCGVHALQAEPSFTSVKEYANLVITCELTALQLPLIVALSNFIINV
jgi:hypothetical protein